MNEQQTQVSAEAMALVEQVSEVKATQMGMPVFASSPTPGHLLQLAMSQNATIEQMERLMAMQERWEANEARKAFNAALAAFKLEPVHVTRTKEIKDGPLKGKKHAELGEILEAVGPSLAKHGLHLSWRLSRDEKDWIEVTCTIKHAGGHSESVAMGGGPDTGPGRNAIQARGSAKTYLERYTATAILGMAPVDGDDDGKGSGGGKHGSASSDHKPVVDDALVNRSKAEAAKGLKAYQEWYLTVKPEVRRVFSASVTHDLNKKAATEADRLNSEQGAA